MLSYTIQSIDDVHNTITVVYENPWKVNQFDTHNNDITRVICISTEMTKEQITNAINGVANFVESDMLKNKQLQGVELLKLSDVLNG